MRSAILCLLIWTFFLFNCLISPAAGADIITSSDLDYLSGVSNYINQNYAGDSPDDLLENVISAMFTSLDPYSEYYDLEQAELFMHQYDGEYEGIGVALSEIDQYVVLIKVFPGCPAQKAGLLPGDKIIEIDSQSVVGWSAEEVTALLAGDTGSIVNMKVMRPSPNEVLTFEVKREPVNPSSIRYNMQGDTAYLAIDSFNTHTDGFVEQALDYFEQYQAKKMILDLRDNGGGTVDAAVMTAQRLVPAGVIATLNYPLDEAENVVYKSDLTDSPYRLCVLVNADTASASEILAAAVQESGAGILVGQNTFGKATVQTVVPILTPTAYKYYRDKYSIDSVDASSLIWNYMVELEENDILGLAKMTVGYYLTPKGNNIDGKGLKPDVIASDPPLVNQINIKQIDNLSLTKKYMINDNGIDIFMAESILALAGYDIGIPDFTLDLKTEDAIKKFQTDNNLIGYGALDFSTQQALNDELAEIRLAIDPQYQAAYQSLNR